MRAVPAAALIALLAACTTETRTTTTVVSTVTPEQTQACVAAAAEARGVPEALVTSPTVSASPTGAIVTLNVNGEMATCRLDTAGNVSGVTFG